MTGLFEAIAITAFGKLFDVLLWPGIERAVGLRGRRLKREALRARYCSAMDELYARLRMIKVLVFPLKPQRLDSLYVELYLSGPDAEGRDGRSIFDIIDLKKRILVQDTGGMGKSTLLKWLCLHEIKKGERIPLYIELQSLGEELDVFTAIAIGLGLGAEMKDLVLPILSSGGVVVIMDGFDELGEEYRSRTLGEIKELVAKAPKNWYVLSSRNDSSLTCLADFVVYSIRRLTKSEAYDLLKKYDSNAGGGKCADKLIDELEAGGYSKVKDLLGNPMQVSLLLKAYSYRAKIPFEKHLFYNQVYVALYEDHDLTKGLGFDRVKHCGLGFDDFTFVLKYIGYSGAKTGNPIFSRSELVRHIEAARERMPNEASFAASQFVRDLISTVPLFVNEGGVYSWAHKTVQDYFAARFIVEEMGEGAEEVVSRVMQNDRRGKFQNVIEFLCDIKPVLGHELVIIPFLEGFLHYWDSAYRHEYPGVPAEVVDYRRAVSYKHHYVMYNVDNVADVIRAFSGEADREETIAALAGEAATESGADFNTFSFMGMHGESVAVVVGMLPGEFVYRVIDSLGYDVFDDSDPKVDGELNRPVHWDGRILITDSPECPVNSVANFPVANFCMITHTKDSRCLSIHKVRELLPRLKAGVARCKAMGSLLEGL